MLVALCNRTRRPRARYRRAAAKIRRVANMS